MPAFRAGFLITMRKKYTFFYLFLLCLILIDKPLFAQFLIPQQDNFSSAFLVNNTSLKTKYQSYGTEAMLGSVEKYNIFSKVHWGEFQSSPSNYFPKYLYEGEINLHILSKDESFLFSAASKADKIFHSMKESDMGFTYTHDINAWSNKQSTWVFVLSYSSRRSFWGGIPIPFLSYRYMSENFVFLAPFYARWNFNKKLYADCQWLPINRYKTSIKWSHLEKFSLELQNGINLEQFFMADRANSDEALYLENSYFILKPVIKLSNKAELSISAGWLYNNRYYHGESYDDRNNKVHVKNGLAAGISLKLFI